MKPPMPSASQVSLLCERSSSSSVSTGGNGRSENCADVRPRFERSSLTLCPKGSWLKTRPPALREPQGGFGSRASRFLAEQLMKRRDDLAADALNVLVDIFAFAGPVEDDGAEAGA